MKGLICNTCSRRSLGCRLECSRWIQDYRRLALYNRRVAFRKYVRLCSKHRSIRAAAATGFFILVAFAPAIIFVLLQHWY